MEKTTIYLPTGLHRQLKDLAHRRNQPQAELIRQALAEYLRGRSKPQLQSIGLGEDRELSGAESEDYLRGRWSRL